MPKSIIVDPKAVRKSGEIEIPPIPINQYASDPAKEVKKYGQVRSTDAITAEDRWPPPVVQQLLATGAKPE